MSYLGRVLIVRRYAVGLLIIVRLCPIKTALLIPIGHSHVAAISHPQMERPRRRPTLQ